MDWIKISKILLKYWYAKTTYWFLMFCLVIWSVALYLFYISISQIICEAIQSISKSILIKTTGIVFIVGILLIVLFWFRSRKLPKYKKGEIGVLFAPFKANGECDPEIVDLSKRLQFDLLSREGMDNVICNRLPFNHMITNDNEAKKLLENTKASIIIHGKFDHGNLNNKEVKGFLSISFTVWGLNWGILKESERSFIIGSIGPRQFISFNENSFKDEDIVVNNINDLSLYLISLSFILNRDVNKAIEILDGLRNKHIASNNRNIKRFIIGINSHLTFCYDFLINKLYKDQIIVNITQSHINNHMSQFLEFTRKRLAVSNDNISYHLAMSIYNFHSMNIDKAKSSLSRIEITDKSDNNFHLKNISLAFLHMWEINYKRSLEFYRKSSYWMKKISKDENLKKITDDVLIFIESVLLVNPDKYYLYFSMGFISEHCNKEEIALSNYRIFLEKNQGVDNALKQHADKYLAKHVTLIE
ncbi:MAG TPA: hypothetical protein DD381_07405 [Lentisphaeria bacterium]|nr:MAG: hypothetical protein A2X47_03985 [Lentisphaerae bacterium GWF2_38_69]HBM16148.1 hypothetical protein [Lentisphaeria bacterium]